MPDAERSHANPYAATPPNALREEAERTGIPRLPLHRRSYGADVTYRTSADVWDKPDHTYVFVEESPDTDTTAGLMDWEESARVPPTDSSPEAAPAPHSTPRRRPLPIYELHGEGHSWGCMGSGPAQLALDILLDSLGEWPDRAAMNRGESEAELMHQDLKAEILAKLNQRMGWRLAGVVVADWIVNWKNRNRRRYETFLVARGERALLDQMRPFEELLADGADLTADQQAAWQRLRAGWDQLQRQ